MQDAYRHGSIDLKRQLLRAPWAFEFYQAVRILGAATSAGGRPSRLRFRSSASLCYPVGDVEAVRVLREHRLDGDLEATVSALADPDVDVEVVQAFICLLGTFGALPLGYTEWIASRESDRGQSAAHPFLDLLCHRVVEQYYAAWRYLNPVLEYEASGDNVLARVMAAMAGRVAVRDTSAHDVSRAAISDEEAATVCAALRQKPMSAPYLSRILSVVIGEAIRVEDFVGAWYDLPPDLYTRLGTANATLGIDTVLGARTWQRHLRLRLHIGPLRLHRYREFLADGPAAASLRKWLRALLGSAYEYEVVPLLHRDDVRPARLGSGNFSCLGRDTFLSSGPGAKHRDDARYLLAL